MTAGPILVAGASGQVARALASAARADAAGVIALGRRDMDITDAAAVRAAVARIAPAAIINAAAYTAVDAAEDDAESAFAVNADGAGHLAEAAAWAGVPMVHLSTDYVFDGTKAGPYVETDPVAPAGVYARSKETGERLVRSASPDHAILRTAWVFSADGNNFVRTMLRVGATRERLQVVDDQVGNPTPAAAIAAAAAKVARHLLQDPDPAWRGTFHFTGDTAMSWHQFALQVFDTAERLHGYTPPAVDPIPSSAWPTRVARPANSRLDGQRLAQVHGIAPAPLQPHLDTVVRRLLATPTSVGDATS